MKLDKELLKMINDRIDFLLKNPSEQSTELKWWSVERNEPIVVIDITDPHRVTDSTKQGGVE